MSFVAGEDGRLERALDEARAVLFLCSGNMVRSAFAELYARHLGCPLPVSSAATRFRNGKLLEETVRALEQRGVPRPWVVAFRPRHLQDLRSQPKAGTLVFAMARMHLEALAGDPELARHSFLLARLLGSEEDIADPVLEGADFERTFERVAACVVALIERLRR